MKFVKLLVVFMVAFSLGLAGCDKKDETKKDEAKKEEGKKDEAKKDEAKKDEAKKDEAKKEEAKKEEKKDEAKKEEAKKEGAEGLDKEKIAKAYTEIYCAQKKGDTKAVMEIYKKYGYDTPDKWTKVWEEAAKDQAWLQKISMEAVKACP